MFKNNTSLSNRSLRASSISLFRKHSLLNTTTSIKEKAKRLSEYYNNKIINLLNVIQSPSFMPDDVNNELSLYKKKKEEFEKLYNHCVECIEKGISIDKEYEYLLKEDSIDIN